jgi:sugar phosphate isomerase/epimerase
LRSDASPPTLRFSTAFDEELIMEKWPIGVFTSIDAGLGVKLEVAHELGIPTIQMHAPHASTRTKENAERFLARLKELGITLTAVFGGFDGESYADIPTVSRTVGLVPRETRTERLKEMKEIADFAKLLGCDVVALHLGFVPHDKNDPLYDEVVRVTRELCDHCKINGQNLHLETGQETAEGLLQFIMDTEAQNLFINFDPANMILYGTGEPIAALERVGQFVRSVHCKDGKWAKNPGQEWGQEVPLGEGDVNFERYLSTLDAIGYTGPLTIEREIPQEPERQKAEIGHAVKLLTELKQKLAK